MCNKLILWFFIIGALHATLGCGILPNTVQRDRSQPSVRAGIIPDDSPSPLRIEMVAIPGGVFWMGSESNDPDAQMDEKPRHQVWVAAFSLGQYEVTQNQWRAVMGNNPSHFKKCGGNCPVEEVSYNDVQDFIAKLNNKTGQHYRLPTETEWEYACRAGGTETYCGSNTVDAVAWYGGNSGTQTYPVGQKQANAFGLYDMSGNVWEWTCSAYNGGYNDSEKICNNNADYFQATRGGSWFYSPEYVRSANRDGNASSARYNLMGFRLVKGRF